MLRRLFAATLLVLLLLMVAMHFNHAAADVAFMGDSITYGWAFPRADFGIKGQTTAEMLERFPTDVTSRHYRKVVILGGTNDTLLGISPAVTVANLQAMVLESRAAGVEPVLASIPPIYSHDGRFLAAAATLDQQIVALAQQLNVPVADYYHALLGHPGCFSDGTHLKRRGYVRMELALVRATNPFV